MGRRPVDKERIDDPELKSDWIKQLAPVYLRNGLNKFTMDDIASKLGISKATLYKYYSSREEILDDVVQKRITDIELLEEDLKDDKITFTKRYFETIKKASIMLAEMSNNFLADTRQLYPELWEKMRNFQNRAFIVAETFYKKGIEAGIMNDINPKILALTDKMLIAALSDERFLGDADISLQNVFDGYFEMKSNGIFKQQH
jgi:AcrR family transcriptional regulator